MAKTIDFNKPYATVHGVQNSAVYSQEGSYFNASGKAIDMETGDEAEELEVEPVEPVEPVEQAPTPTPAAKRTRSTVAASSDVI